MARYVGFRQGKVHERHVISEYYCGRCGWPVTDHDSFCPECGGAFRKCDANDEKIHQLESENAKLKELVRDMWHDIPKTESCGWDMSTNTCTGSDECIGECSYWYRMHKLGIEVK